jgi:cytochrome c556
MFDVRASKLTVAVAALSIALGCSVAGAATQPAKPAAKVAAAKSAAKPAVAPKAAPAPAMLSRAAGIEASKSRTQKMKDLGGDYKTIVDELKKRRPNLELIQFSANNVGDRSPQLVNWFPRGSGPEVGKTKAKPEIWTHFDDFTVLGKAAAVSAAKLRAAADGGDMDAIRAASQDMGQACKACHDKYRVPED